MEDCVGLGHDAQIALLTFSMSDRRLLEDLRHPIHRLQLTPSTDPPKGYIHITRSESTPHLMGYLHAKRQKAQTRRHANWPNAIELDSTMFYLSATVKDDGEAIAWHDYTNKQTYVTVCPRTTLKTGELETIRVRLKHHFLSTHPM